MKKQNILEATFLDRPNRFLSRVDLKGEITEAFVPNPGRMYELMVPGKKVYLRPNSGQHRKTAYDMIAVMHDGILISIDSNLPNRFMKRILQNHELNIFRDYNRIKPEPSMYEGRFDFLLSGKKKILIEVKSCTLVVNNRAIFPDSPTIRGARHMKHLADALVEGIVDEAYVVFVIQRPDAEIFSPNDETDPNFGNMLRESHKLGVKVVPIVTELVDWDLKVRKIVPYDLKYFINMD